MQGAQASIPHLSLQNVRLGSNATDDTETCAVVRPAVRAAQRRMRTACIRHRGGQTRPGGDVHAGEQHRVRDLEESRQRRVEYFGRRRHGERVTAGYGRNTVTTHRRMRGRRIYRSMRKSYAMCSPGNMGMCSPYTLLLSQLHLACKTLSVPHCSRLHFAS